MAPEGKTVVVGGGVAGLSIAHALITRDANADVTVLEAREHSGGFLRSQRREGFLCEHGPSAFLVSETPAAIELCQALGIEMVAPSPAAKQRWVYKREALREVPMSPGGLLRSDLLSWPARLRLLVEPLMPRGPDREETIAEFARRRLGKEAAENLVAPFVLGVFAGDAETLSVTAAFPQLAEMEARHGSLLRGALAGRPRGGAPRVARLQAPREGAEALPRALTAALGDRVRLGARVTNLQPQPDGSVRVDVAGGASLVGTTVVLAVPPYAAAELVAACDAKLAESLTRARTVGAVVVHATLEATPSLPFDGFGFLVAKGEPLRCLGCVYESSIWPDRAPPGQVLLRFILGGDRDPAALTLDDAAIAALIHDDLRRVFPEVAAPRILGIVRWPRAIPQYPVGHAAWLAVVERGAARLGFVLAGNGYHGISVKDCVLDAARVVRLIEQRSGLEEATGA